MNSLLFILNILLFLSIAYGTSDNRKYPYERWMNEYYDYLKNHTLLEIPFPATHDSGILLVLELDSMIISLGAYQLTKIWSPGGFGNDNDNAYIELADRFNIQLWKIVRPWSLCHSGSLSEQLYYGIRAFDIRAMWDGDWYIHHNLRGLPLRTVLKDIHDFIKSHTTELVILDISHIDIYSRPGYNRTELYELLDGYFDGYYIDSEVPLESTPFSQLIKENKRVLIHLEDPEAGKSLKKYWNFDTSSEGVYSNQNTFLPMKEFNTNQIRTLGGHHQFVITFWTLTPRVQDLAFSVIPCLTRYESLLGLASETSGIRLRAWMEENKRYHPGNLVYVDDFKNVNIVSVLLKFIQRDCYDDYEYIARKEDQTDCRSSAERGICNLNTTEGLFIREHCRLSCGLC